MSPVRTPAARRQVVAAVLVALVGGLAGCGDPAFEPSKARPCDFFTAEERDEYALVAKLDEPNRCGFEKKPDWWDSLTGVTVEYRDGDPATVATTLGLAAVDGKESEDSTVAFKGSVNVDASSRTGICVFVAPIDDRQVLIVGIGTDTSGSTWFQQDPIDDPCEYVAYEFEEIEAKLRRP